MISLLLFVGVILVIVVVIVVRSLRTTVDNLRYELRKLAGRVDEMERARIPAPSRVVESQPVHIMAAPEAPPPAVPGPTATAVAAPQPLPQDVSPPAAPTRTQAEWEALIGGKFLNRIGALALIIGMGFFLKYAFDRNWINEWMRVGIGIGSGLALLVAGARFHRKGLPIFAQGLVGAGIAILYLSVYASFNFYHLVSQPVAFILMAAVTVLTFTQAFFYNALAVSLLGWLGGFLTPFLLSTGEAHPVALFSYITMLDIGLIAVLVLRRKWAVLAPLSLAATYLLYYLWYGSSAGTGDGAVALLFLAVFWGLFHGYDAMTEMRRGEPSDLLRRVTAVANVVVFYPGLYTVLDRFYQPWLAPATVVVAALYAASSALVQRAAGKPTAAAVQYAVTAIVLLVIATEIHFGDFVVIAVYVAEALVLFWIGKKTSLTHVWGMGIGVLLWACLVALATDNAFFYHDVQSFVLLWNLRSLAFLSLAGGAGILLFLMRNVRDGRAESIRTMLHLIWAFFVFLLVTAETGDYFGQLALGGDETAHAYLLFQRLMTMGLLWLLLGAVLFSAGHRRRIVTLAVSGLVIIILGAGLVAVRGIAFDPITAFVSVFNIRVLVLLLATALLGWSLHEITRTRVLGDWDEEIRLLLQIVLVIVTLVLVSGEIRDYYERAIAWRSSQGASGTLDLENLKQMFLSTGWLVYSIGLMSVGLLRRLRTLRIIAMVLFGIAILKIFFYDLSFLETLYRIVSFIGLGIILLTVSYLYQRYRSAILDDVPDQ